MGNSVSGGRSAVAGRGRKNPDRLVQAAANLQRGLNRRGLKVQNIRQRFNLQSGLNRAEYDKNGKFVGLPSKFG